MDSLESILAKNYSDHRSNTKYLDLLSDVEDLQTTILFSEREEMSDVRDRYSDILSRYVTFLEESSLNPLTEYQQRIKDEVEKRKIKYLIHFTRRDNLTNILENGLLGRNSLADKRIGYYYNDQQRIDNIADGICCSISFPNYKMFWSIRKNHESLYGVNVDDDWVILRLNPELLWQKKAYFCRNNAASNQERFNQRKMDSESLKAMFGDLDYVDRKQLRIPDNFTTDPQAEVVFVEAIEPDWIIDICKKKGYGMDCYKPDQLRVAYKYEHDTLFKPRSDYQYWTKH